MIATTAATNNFTTQLDKSNEWKWVEDVDIYV